MQWTIDPKHSSVDFAVKHMGLSTVRGRFQRVSGTVDAGEDGTLRGVQIVIEAGSVHTNESQRDEHLRSGDFLDAGKYPRIVFRSTAAAPRGGGRYLVTGDLTVRDQTRPVTLEVEMAAPVKDPWGNTRAAATGSGKLNRKDWGLTYNKALELGGWLVGDEVKFTFDAEAVAAVPAAAG